MVMGLPVNSLTLATIRFRAQTPDVLHLARCTLTIAALMYTQCPACFTIFAVDAATLAQAHGCVGCGHCGATFDTMATLTDEVPSTPFASLEINYPSAEPPLVVRRFTDEIVAQESLFPSESSFDVEPDEDAALAAEPAPDAALEHYIETGTDTDNETGIGTDNETDSEIDIQLASESTIDVEADQAYAQSLADEFDIDASQAVIEDEELALNQELDEPEETTIEFDTEPLKANRTPLDLDAEIAQVSARLTRRERMGQPLRKRLLLGCAALAVCLVVQLAWAERAALARNPSTAPLVQGVCKLFHCAPMIKDLDQLALISRDVRKHPSVNHALMISATMRNNAAFAQPFPILAITLSDLDDNLVAMRRFRPAEYLHDAEVRAAGLAPGASTALVFEVQDPGQDAVAFEFAFE